MAYEFLAGCYDEFTADVPYRRWADYLEKHFARSALPIQPCWIWPAAPAA